VSHPAHSLKISSALYRKNPRTQAYSWGSGKPVN